MSPWPGLEQSQGCWQAAVVRPAQGEAQARCAPEDGDWTPHGFLTMQGLLGTAARIRPCAPDLAPAVRRSQGHASRSMLPCVTEALASKADLGLDTCASKDLIPESWRAKPTNSDDVRL